MRDLDRFSGFPRVLKGAAVFLFQVLATSYTFLWVFFMALSKACIHVMEFKHRVKLERSGALFKFRVCCSGALTVAVLQSRNLAIFWCIVGHLVI